MQWLKDIRLTLSVSSLKKRASKTIWLKLAAKYIVKVSMLKIMFGALASINQPMVT